MTFDSLKRYIGKEVIITLKKVRPFLFDVKNSEVKRTNSLACVVMDVDASFLHFSSDGIEIEGSVPLDEIGLIQLNIEIPDFLLELIPDEDNLN